MMRCLMSCVYGVKPNFVEGWETNYVDLDQEVSCLVVNIGGL